ncbi:hypothetical protein HKX48_008770 [Thoreauomyces humboldtii]|nr:hypothetical protein HKX48_008770 [Thoreauomyces humboldtii]
MLPPADALREFTLAQGAEFQLVHTPARPDLFDMHPLYLSSSLNHRTEALRNDVLRAHLFQQVLSVEYATSYGRNATTLTVAPLGHATAIAQAASPDVSNKYPGSNKLPPITRALYVRVLRNMPIFAGRGDAFLATMDAFVDNEFLEFVGLWTKATKFDMLSFSMHYVTLFTHLKNEAWYGVDDRSEHLPAGWVAPMMLPSSLYPELLTYYRAALPGGGTFRLTKRIPTTVAGSPEATAELLLRQHKMAEFTRAWRDALKPASDIARDLASNMADTPLDVQFWAVVKASPEVADMPPRWQSFFYGLVKAVAHTVDQVLDDNEWRQKFASIWKRLPVTIMLTSLRLVNPVPFIDRVIKLFCWKPPGMFSLLQRIGGMMAATDLTNAALKTLAKPLDTLTRLAVERTLTTLLPADASGTQARISSQDPPETIRGALIGSSDPALADPQPATIAYAKMWIRKKEKDAFVDALGGSAVTDFLTHMASAIPPLLDEIWVCVDFAALMGTLVESVTQVLAALAAYDSPPSTTREAQSTEVVQAIYEALLPFFKAGHPLLHALATKPGKHTDNLSGLIALVNYFLSTCIAPTDGSAAIMALAADARPALAALSTQEKKYLYEEVDAIIKVMESAADQRDPRLKERPVLDSLALKAYWVHLAKQLAGDHMVSESHDIPAGDLDVD